MNGELWGPLGAWKDQMVRVSYRENKWLGPRQLEGAGARLPNKLLWALSNQQGMEGPQRGVGISPGCEAERIYTGHRGGGK